jgi:hypothetical protein
VVVEEDGRIEGVTLLRPHQVEVAVARALGHLDWEDAARGEFLAYMLAARMPFPGPLDNRMAVPDFIAYWAKEVGPS